jgi:hypothetical protein
MSSANENEKYSYVYNKCIYIYTAIYYSLPFSPDDGIGIYNFKVPTKKYKIHKYSRIYIHRSSVLAFATVGVFVSQFS